MNFSRATSQHLPIPHYPLRDRIECPVCGGKNGKVRLSVSYLSSELRGYLIQFYKLEGLSALDHLSGYYTLLECNACRLIYQKSVPTDEFLQVIYDDWLSLDKVCELHQKELTLDLYKNYMREIASFISIIGLPPKSLAFLDFGMGWGDWIKAAEGLGVTAYGLELSHDRIKYANINGVKTLDLKSAQNFKFDVINADQVFEHLSDPINTLLGLVDLLKEDGLIKISIPTCHDIDLRLLRPNWTIDKRSLQSLNALAPLEHLQYYRYSSVKMLASRCNLKVIKIPFFRSYFFTSLSDGLIPLLRNCAKPILRNYHFQNYYILKKL